MAEARTGSRCRSAISQADNRKAQRWSGISVLRPRDANKTAITRPLLLLLLLWLRRRLHSWPWQSAVVVRAARRFWDLMLLLSCKTAATTTVTREAYQALHMRISKALTDGFDRGATERAAMCVHDSV